MARWSHYHHKTLTSRIDLTKYDCSSADLNPIGSISKVDLKRFIAWASEEFDLPILEDFIHATPTAELEPITSDYVCKLFFCSDLDTDIQKTQSDEVDMKMTYAELSRFGTLRKVNHLGPYGMFLRLLEEWGGEGKLSPREIGEKVSHTFESRFPSIGSFLLIVW
jgi:NAD+ synthase (glutamine-hydrolysing)